MPRTKGSRNRIKRPAKIAHCVRLTAEETAALEAFGGVTRGIRWLIREISGVNADPKPKP